MRSELQALDGVVVPGGFGERGVDGKIKAIEFARKNNKPFFGLCYGMQLAVIEFARNVAGMRGAHTTEVNPRTKYPVIDLMREQEAKIFAKKLGGTMRLGAYACRLSDKTIARMAYGKRTVYERHRHRYEFNSALRKILESKGLVVSGVNPESGLVEIIELKNHPFFLGTQFHPEFKSRFLNPHPLFSAFIKAAYKAKQQNKYG